MSVIRAMGGKNKGDAYNASLVAFVADEPGRQAFEQSLGQLGVADSHVARGSIDAVIAYLGRVEKAPQRLIVDISGIDKPMAALDRLAEACDPSVKVYVLGDTN
ncbi:MAG TPA: fimbrial protein, partial [Eoetvoesiella sp.]